MSDHEAGLSSCIPTGGEHRCPTAHRSGFESWLLSSQLGAGRGGGGGARASDPTPLGLSVLVLRKGTVPSASAPFTYHGAPPSGTPTPSLPPTVLGTGR